MHLIIDALHYISVLFAHMEPCSAALPKAQNICREKPPEQQITKTFWQVTAS